MIRHSPAAVNRTSYPYIPKPSRLGRRARATLPAALLLLLLVTASCTSTAPHHDLRVAVISDLNSSYGSTEYEPEVPRVVDLILEDWKPDLVLSAGDLIAGQKPDLPDERVRKMWAAFDSVVAGPLRRAGIPFAFTLGNHDGSAYPAHRRDRQMAIDHWRSPDHHPGISFVDSTRFPEYYSLLHDDLYVLVWDASFEGTAEDAEMMAWMRRALEGEAARNARYRLVLGHLPLYGVAEGRNRRGEVLHQGDSLRQVLEDLDVDMYVSGHHHAYYPARRGAVELLHAGALGQGTRPLIGTDEPSPQSVTLLDFDAAADAVEYTTYGFSDGEIILIETTALPRVIRGYNGHVVRRDLTESEADAAGTTPADSAYVD